MRILFLTPQLPYPPQKGTALRNWGLISGLAERHEVAVLSFIASPPMRGLSRKVCFAPTTLQRIEKRTNFLPPSHPFYSKSVVVAPYRIETVEPPIRTLRDRLYDMLTTRQPDMALRLASEAYARRLADWLARESFDVVHIEGIELAPYLDVIEAVYPSLFAGGMPPPSLPGKGAGGLGRAPSPARRGESALSRPLVVFDDHNCEYLLQQRAFLTDLRIPARWPGAVYSFVQWHRLRRYEAQACRRADRVLAVSEADAEALKKLVPGLDVTVIPNGIDTRAYRPESSNVKRQIPKPESQIVFTGTMDFRPNVDAVLWFARRVLPQVRAEVPEVRFVVVGQHPHRRLDGLRDDPAVTLTGWVEDTRSYIAQAAVCVAPLRMGGGTRLKLLEAMAMGKPVVATRLGAEGYPVADGRELLLADTPADFAMAVVALLRAPERRAELGQAGRAFVEQRYDWRVIVPRVEAVYGQWGNEQ